MDSLDSVDAGSDEVVGGAADSEDVVAALGVDAEAVVVDVPLLELSVSGVDVATIAGGLDTDSGIASESPTDALSSTMVSVDP